MSGGEKSLKNLIGEVLDTYGLKDKLHETKLIDQWENIVGPLIAKHTTKVYINQQKLFVKVDSAPLKQELCYSTEKMLDLVNDALGEPWVKEIIVR